MEEKLYFAPAKFGKGKKKEQKSSEPGNKKRFLKLAGFLIFLLVVGGVIFWFLHGKTTVSGNFPANITTESLACSSDGSTYEKVSYNGSLKNRARITIIFEGTESLRNYSLSYTMSFSSNAAAKSAEGVIHYNFGRDLSANGFGFSEFDNRFSIQSNELIISLYASKEDLARKNAAPFFMLEEGNHLATLVDYRTFLESINFTCRSTTDNK